MPAGSHTPRPPLWPAVLGVALSSVVLLGLVVFVAAWKDLPASSLTRDPVVTEGLRWQTGFLYKIGMLLWGAVTATCLLGAATWRGDDGARGLRSFLWASAAVILLLALDDTFQLRGELYPDHLGLPEVAVLAFYAVVLGIVAIVFRSTLLRTEYVVLAAAAALFVLWLVLRQSGAERAVQDGVKLAGQLMLLLYFFRTSAYGTDLRRLDA